MFESETRQTFLLLRHKAASTRKERLGSCVLRAFLVNIYVDMYHLSADSI
jgi:hypothetical protein